MQPTDGAVSLGGHVPNEHGEQDPTVAAAFEAPRGAAIADMPPVGERARPAV